MTPQGDGGIHPAQGQGAACHGHDHILDIADVHHDGHQNAWHRCEPCRRLRNISSLTASKPVLGLLLVAEDLDHLLAVDHLLDIAVRAPRVRC